MFLSQQTNAFYSATCSPCPVQSHFELFWLRSTEFSMIRQTKGPLQRCIRMAKQLIRFSLHCSRCTVHRRNSFFPNNIRIQKTHTLTVSRTERPQFTKALPLFGVSDFARARTFRATNTARRIDFTRAQSTTGASLTISKANDEERQRKKRSKNCHLPFSVRVCVCECHVL